MQTEIGNGAGGNEWKKARTCWGTSALIKVDDAFVKLRKDRHAFVSDAG